MLRLRTKLDDMTDEQVQEYVAERRRKNAEDAEAIAKQHRMSERVRTQRFGQLPE